MHLIKESNNIINIIKGDYCKFPITLFKGRFPTRQKMVLENDDKAYFGIFDSNVSFDQAIIKKVLTKDNMDEYDNLWVTLLPEDTVNLAVGTYYYEVKALYKDEDNVEHIDTAVQRTKFIVLD